MKRLISICVLISGMELSAQEPMTFQELIAGVKEINLSDSLRFDTNPAETIIIDSGSVKKWFMPILSAASGNKFKKRTFSLAGKITSNNNFDLLLLREEKKKNDSTGIQIIHLVSTKKDGEYIASLEAAVSGTRKKTDYNISSCLYPDYKIILDSRITVNDKLLTDVTNYKINSGGRFIVYPKFE